MAKKSGGYGRGKAPTSGRIKPQAGGPKASALGSAMGANKKRTGGWKNGKIAPITGAAASEGYASANQMRMAGSNAGPTGGSLAMSGKVRIKHPRSAASHFGTAQPAGKAARKVSKAKAPGK
jgi:hypothetical protein